MDAEFEEVGRTGYMEHNGGFLFRKVAGKEYEFRATIKEYHLNPGGISHGGYIMTLLDSGMGSAVYEQLGSGNRIATISLDVKFVAPSYKGDIIVGRARIIKKTRSMVFCQAELRVGSNIVATGDGIWKILTT